MFQRRTAEEVLPSDSELVQLVRADHQKELYKQWSAWSPGCHLFLVGSSLFARGTKEEVAWAEGYVFGWRSALRNCK